MERYVAIDNVCAWPNLTQMPDGSIVASIFNQPTHGGWEGDVECWASTDGGITWTLRGTAAVHEPTTNRMNVAAGLARDGSLIVLAAGWTNRPPTTEVPKVYFADSDILPAWVCHSIDGGATWTREGSIAFLDGLAVMPMPFGDIVQLPDGTLGVSLYGRDAVDVADGISAHLYISEDDGLTWQHRSVIGAKNYNETNLVVLRDGTLLAAARTWDDHHLELFTSADSGQSWQGGTVLSLAGQHPANLIQLADDRVLLVYGLRNPGLYGVAARISADGGHTWSQPHLLVDLGGKVDCGYPASVQLADGTVVTAYYAAHIPQHQRYHMGVVRWQVDG